MNSGPPDAETFTETETYVALRKHGYKFCREPAAIQCFNLKAKLFYKSGIFGTTCSLDNGLQCSFLCDDWQVRVACCYCPPDAIGKLMCLFCFGK